MTPLQTFANGDTNYVSKLNNNFSTLEGSVNTLETNVAAQIGSALTGGQAFSAIFGPSLAVIGVASCLCHGSGSILTVDAGFFWNPVSSTVVKRASSSTIDFTGLSANTYYVQIDDTGAATQSTSSSLAFYSVVWTGSAFGTITRVCALVFGAEGDLAVQTSTALAATYTSVDARLEAGEAAAVTTTAEVVAARNSVAHGAYGSLDARLEAIDSAVASGGGTVTTVSVVSANGFSGSVANATTTPAITLTLTDAELSAIAGLTSAADKIPYFTGSGTAALLTRDTDVALTADSDTVLATQKAVKTYVDAQFAGAGTGDVVGPGSASDEHFAMFDGTTGKLIQDTGLALDTDTALTANSDAKIASQKAVKAYVDSLVTGGAADVMRFLGVIDASANPNYPAADAGHLYKISVAGKIGGGSGPNVEIGDTIYCITDSTSSGTHASVGANWDIVQVNVDGAVTGPASATADHVVTFNGTTGKIVKDSGLTLAGTNTGDETTTTVGTLISGATAKTTPVDADFIGLMDSAASNILKKLSWANVKATAKTYFDTLYRSKAASIYSPAYSATLVLDLSQVEHGGIIRVGALTGNITLQVSNGTDGQHFTVELLQDGTGSRLVTFDTSHFRYGTDITGFTATTTASKLDRVACIYRSANSKADIVATVKGF